MPRLVSIGDSITQGFKSGSICDTELSYPALIAECLGINSFRYPNFKGAGGLPCNLEGAVRMLEERYGDSIEWFEQLQAPFSIRSFMDAVEDYWERGDGLKTTATGPVHHNLAVWGFEIGDADTVSEGLCKRLIPPPSDDVFQQIPEFPMYRTARRTLNPTYAVPQSTLTQLDLAKQLADQEGGVENLLIALGANNCLGTVTELKIVWSEESDTVRYPHERKGNLWLPEHFAKVYKRMADKVDAVHAQRVFVGTVPPVTVPPVCRGVSRDLAHERDADGYYEYYTHFWVWDEDFRKNPDKYDYLIREDARRIDQTIVAYNEIIRAEAGQRGWHVVDIWKVLKDLAFRRNAGDPPGELPDGLVAAWKTNPATRHRVDLAGKPVLDTRYYSVDPSEADPTRKFQGGLFSLDGIHPTTVGYGILADEFLRVMQGAGVSISHALDWNSLINRDTLISNPPQNLANLRNLAGFLDSRFSLKKIVQMSSRAGIPAK